MYLSRAFPLFWSKEDDNFPQTSLYACQLEQMALNVFQSWVCYNSVELHRWPSDVSSLARCALISNRAKKEGEKGRAINTREKGNVDESQ